MIESSFSYSSSWDSPSVLEFSETPYSELDDCLQDFEMRCSDFSTFNDLSNSSSIYDEFDFNDIDKILPLSDSFISQVLEENNSIGNEDRWSLPDDEQRCLPCENSSTSIKESPRKVKKSFSYFSNKLWSKMSSEEQLQTLHSLSEIVTCHMGIREQIEVIKIIDPSVTISPDDKEFALDISHLNDAKMKRIRNFVQKQKLHLSNFSKKLNSPKKNLVSKKTAQISNLSRKTNSKSKKKPKQETFTEKSVEDIHQKRKLELHGRKEIRSGLFVYEKVIKKLSNPLEEDEDVNILE